MKITKLSLYVVASDKWSVNTRYIAADQLGDVLETTILRIETDAGITGWGETCTAPSYYLPTLASGARAAIRHVAPLLIGADPRRLRRIMADIDAAMRGQGPAKSAIEMALWDLCGKAHGLPLVDLWGGRVVDDMPVLCLVDMDTPERMLEDTAAYREQGYRLFQMKIGDGSAQDEVDRIRALQRSMRPGERCWFDPNRAWTVDHAMDILPKVADLGPLIEQPCETYRECRTLARRCGVGLMLDEVVDGPEIMAEAAEDGVIRVAVLKFSCTGGIRRHKEMIDVGLRLGIPMRIEDFYGTGLTLAAVCHLAQGAPAAATFGLYDYHLPALPVARNPFPVAEGRIRVPEDCAPGLGVDVDTDVIGAPVTELT